MGVVVVGVVVGVVFGVVVGVVVGCDVVVGGAAVLSTLIDRH